MNHFRIRRWFFIVGALALLLVGASGCGGARATSWPGLTVLEEQVYVSDIERLRVFDANDGEVVWSYPDEEGTQGLFHATPVVTDDLVIVPSHQSGGGLFSQPKNIVSALPRGGGDPVWTFEEAEGEYIEGGAVTQGTFVIGNSDGFIYALDLEDGSLRWSFETGHRVWATPLIDSGIVYIGAMDHHLYALRLDDGSVVWDFEAGGAFAGMPRLSDGVLYLGAFDDRLYAVNAESGQEEWSYVGDEWFWGSPQVDGDVVYAADVKGNVLALDAGNGDEIWSKELESSVRGGVALSEDGDKLFVGTEAGTLYALDSEDGTEIWSIENEGQMLSHPVVSESTVYGTWILGNQRVLALREETGGEVWVFPPREAE